MNFNTINRYWLAVTAVLLVSSCSVLEVDPEDQITRENMYNVESDIYAVKTGLYNTMQGLVEQNFVLGELRGDLVTHARGARKNSDMFEFMKHDISPDNRYLDWSGFYALINQCNDALVSFPLLKEKSPDLLNKVYNHIMAEVLWLRAWAYMTLVRNWGDVPFITDPVYSAVDIKAYPVTPEDEILDQLEKDLSWAVANLNVNWSWGQGTSIDAMWNHETVNMCAGVNLLSEVLIYRNKYSDAWSTSALLKIMEPTYVDGTDGHEENWNNSFNLTGLNFDSGKEWFNVQFRYANERYRSSWFEQGLVLAFDTEDGTDGGGMYQERHSLGTITSNRQEAGELYVVKPSIPAILLWVNARDVYRGAGYSYYVDGKDSVIWKYIGLTPQGERRGLDRKTGCGNIQFYRTVDLYLRGSETANRLGLSQKAIDILNQSRARVGVVPVPFKSNATIQEIEDAIMDERASEMAFEGIRWYDLVRIAKRRNDPAYLIDKVVAAAPAADREALRARLELQSENWWKLPYSNKAVMVNPNLKNE